MNSDHSASPDSLVEHITSIYPILKGQTRRRRASTKTNAAPQPAHTTEVASNHNQPAENLVSIDQSPKQTAPIETQTPPPGSAPVPTQSQPQAPAVAPASVEAQAAPVSAPPQQHNGNNDITSMLHSTGKEAPGGPLIDFGADLKKDLPSAENHGNNKNKPIIRRSETEDTDDAFYDAED